MLQEALLHKQGNAGIYLVIVIIRFRRANKRSRRPSSFHLRNDQGFMVYSVKQLLLSSTVPVRGMKTERVFG